MKAPTLEEVTAYVSEMGYHFDPVRFWSVNETAGWIVARGKTVTPMKSWKAACVTWETREPEYLKAKIAAKAGVPAPPPLDLPLEFPTELPTRIRDLHRKAQDRTLSDAEAMELVRFSEERR